MATGTVTVLLLAALVAPAFSAGTLNSQRSDLLPSDCGQRLVQREDTSRPLIVGPGNTSTYYGQFPWQARIEVPKRGVSGYVHQCGGIVITQQYILTAAHCVDHVALNSIVVRVGDWRFGSRDSAEQEFGVSGFHVHNQFGRGARFANDIALLRLKVRRGTGIEFGRFVQPACLPEADTEYVSNTACEVSGWGKTADDAPVSETLRAVSLPLVSDDFCSSPEVHQSRFVSGRMFCAGLVRGGPDACGGDSGGPLVCRDPTNQRFVVYGIVSSGDPRGCGGLPGLYTKLSGFVDWLLRRLQLDLSPDRPLNPPLVVQPGREESSTVDCGRSGFSPPQDVGAAFAERVTDFPWLVSVQSPADDELLCAGAIISDRWVLTDASCTDAAQGSLTVHSAVLNLDTDTPSMQFDVILNKQHPNYLQSSRNPSYDVAILKTSTPIPLSSGLRPICLPDPQHASEVATGQTLIAAGWGAPVTNGIPKRLKWAKMTARNDATCKQNWDLSAEIKRDTFCATYDQPTGGFECAMNYDDYGTPLMAAVTKSGAKRWYALGLPAHGLENCGNYVSYPSAALRYATGWILSVISEK